MTLSVARRMRPALATLVVATIGGCYLSHELGDDAGATSDAATCGATALPPDWASATTTLPYCSIEAARLPPGIALCWSPCTSVALATGCEETPLGRWTNATWNGAVERDGVAYFLLDALTDAGMALDYSVAGSDGSSLAAMQLSAVAPPGGLHPGETAVCDFAGLGLAYDAWGFVLSDRYTDSTGHVLDRGGELHFGAMADVGSWSAPRATGVELAGYASGVTTSPLAALAGEPLLLVDASGTQTSVPPAATGGIDSAVVAIVEGRVLWQEQESGRTVIAQRRTDGTEETFLAGDGDRIAALGVDGPAYVWIEGTEHATAEEVHVFSAPIVVDPSALRPRRVDETVTPGWTMQPSALQHAAFGHATVVMRVDRIDGEDLVVVSIASGLVTKLSFAAPHSVLAAVITSAHQVVLVVGDGTPMQHMLRIDLDALPPFTP